MRYLFHKLKIAQLKRKIERNPFLGERDLDGTYLYKEGAYRLQYIVIESEQLKGKRSIEWLQIKRRLSPSEERLRGKKRPFAKFWHYQGWLSLFRPTAIILLMAVVLIFYFALIEPQKAKVERYRWIIAKVLGIKPDQIEYIGGGWIEFGTKRKTVVDDQYEPTRLRLNPFRWLLRNEAAYVDRWLGDKYSSHQVVYSDMGDLWLRYKGEWQHGTISGEEIKWDSPLGGGIRAGKVSGHEISTEEGSLTIRDK